MQKKFCFPTLKRIGFLFLILVVLAACNHDLEISEPKPSDLPSALTQTLFPVLLETKLSSLSPSNPISSQPAVSQSQDLEPTLFPGPGWVELSPLITGSPPVRSYVCPWSEAEPEIPVYTYRIIRTYPHDPEAYTQGLVLKDGLLLESTGQRGRSSLRQVDLESGDVLREIDLPEPYFGEGITIIDDRIYQLTWQEMTAFVYSSETLERMGSFTFKTEGWGLTDDGQRLIMSDGTSRLQIRDPDNFGVISQLEVSSKSGSVSRLNELEYVEGEIWANIYQTACIARINPQDGQVIGWIDISGLLDVSELDSAEVPNGIAYDPSSKRLFVTGKLWPRLFEIEVLPVRDT